MAVTAEQVLTALKDVKDPSSGRPLSELGMLKGAEILDGSGVRVRVELPALRERLDAMNRRVMLGGRAEADDAPGLEYRPPSVTQRLLRLASSLDGYASKPTTTQLEELAALSKQVDDLEASWKKVSAEDAPAFNKTVTSAGISYLSVGR